MNLYKWGQKAATYGLMLAASSALASHLHTDGSSAEAPDPNQVHIQSIAYAGSGCPAGTVSESVAPDAKAFTLLFDSYVAEAGPGVSLAAGRKNCQIAVDLRFPQGWSYTIFDVDYRGYVQLDRGATGLQKSSYYFQGQSLGPSLQSTFTGPVDKDYHFRDSLGVDAVVYSPCGMSRALNLNTQVRVTARGGSRALMTTDSIDGQLSHVYGIRWKRCR
jgi:hypothetical protein